MIDKPTCDADPHRGNEVCSKCGGLRDPSGVDGGKWIHRGPDYGKITTWKKGVEQKPSEER